MLVEDWMPHRGPALCGIPDVEVSEGGVGSVIMTIPPAWCEGHFPDRPIAPGHWIGEAALVLAGALVNRLLDLHQPIILKRWSVEYVGRNGGVQPEDTIKITAWLSDQTELEPGERSMEAIVSRGSESLFHVSGIGFSAAIARKDLRSGKRR